MPPRDFYIQPANVDIKPVLQGIGALTAGARQAQVKQQKQKQLADVMATNDPDQIADFMIKNPESQAQIKGGMQFRNAATERDYGNFLTGFLANPTRDNFVDMAEARSKFVRDQGGDSSGIDQAIALYDEDPEAAIQKAETALSLFDPKKFKSFQSSKKNQGEADGGASEVQSSRIMEDGTVQFVRKDGTVEVKTLDEANSDIIKRAANFGVDIQSKRSQGRKIGKDAASVSSKAFTQLNNIRGNILNLKNVVSTVGNGADTGPLAKKLPSFRAESIKLDNIRNRLGLDVISGVTFGALSEGELQLALNTALPTGLQGPELVKWANEKIAAQEKLSNYLEEQAVFLGKPGNSISDFIEMKKNEAKKAARSGVDNDQPGQDSEAIAWAKANPGDPRAAQILQIQGAQ